MYKFKYILTFVYIFCNSGAECERYQTRYFGNQRVTASGLRCLRWDELPDALYTFRDLTQFPDLSLEEASNKCR